MSLTSLFVSFWREFTVAFNPREWQSTLLRLRRMKPVDFCDVGRALLPQLVLYYVLLSPIVAAPLYTMMLFHPTMSGMYDVHKIVDCPVQNVFIDSANKSKLHAWFVEAPNAKKVVMISHGNGGNLTYRIPLVALFLKAGVSVLIYDYEGYGKSTGFPTADNIVEDASAAYSWLRNERHYRGNEIILFGESLGTGLSCAIARHNECGGIILQSPYSSLRKLAQQKMLWLNLYPPQLFFGQELECASYLSQEHPPALLLHGAEDRLIPPSHSAEIISAASEPKEFVSFSGRGHNDMYGSDDDSRYLNVLKTFLGRVGRL